MDIGFQQKVPKPVISKIGSLRKIVRRYDSVTMDSLVFGELIGQPNPILSFLTIQDKSELSRVNKRIHEALEPTLQLIRQRHKAIYHLGLRGYPKILFQYIDPAKFINVQEFHLDYNDFELEGMGLWGPIKAEMHSGFIHPHRFKDAHSTVIRGIDPWLSSFMSVFYHNEYGQARVCTLYQCEPTNQDIWTIDGNSPYDCKIITLQKSAIEMALPLLLFFNEALKDTQNPIVIKNKKIL